MLGSFLDEPVAARYEEKIKRFSYLIALKFKQYIRDFLMMNVKNNPN